MLSEVHAVLNALGKKYIDMTPKHVLDNISTNRNMNYKVFIDKDKSIDDQAISEDAISFIFEIKKHFWDKDRENVIEMFKANTARQKREHPIRFFVEGYTKRRRGEIFELLLYKRRYQNRME